MANFKEIDISELKLNFYDMIAKDWLVLSAGDKAGYNSMTVSWAQVGSLWKGEKTAPFAGMPVATTYVRPQRYTKKFVDEKEYFTLSHFGSGFRKELGFLGGKSGRDYKNKLAECGFHPYFTAESVGVEEADVIFVCKKLYTYKMEESGFYNPETAKINYPDKDFHQAYIGEIVRVLVREK